MGTTSGLSATMTTCADSRTTSCSTRSKPAGRRRAESTPTLGTSKPDLQVGRAGIIRPPATAQGRLYDLGAGYGHARPEGRAYWTRRTYSIRENLARIE